MSLVLKKPRLLGWAVKIGARLWAAAWFVQEVASTPPADLIVLLVPMVGLV